MGSTDLKQRIIEAVEHLPEDATERLYLLAKLERGLAQSESGETIPHEDVKQRFLWGDSGPSSAAGHWTT